MINSGGIKGGGKAMMEKNPPIMTLDKTAKYLKKVNSTLYKIAREVKIPAVKIKVGRNNKVIFRVSNNQELIRNVKMIYGRSMNSSRVMCIRNTADIITNLEYICSADMNELAEIPHTALGIFKNKDEIILRRWERWMKR